MDTRLALELLYYSAEFGHDCAMCRALMGPLLKVCERCEISKTDSTRLICRIAADFLDESHAITSGFDRILPDILQTGVQRGLHFLAINRKLFRSGLRKILRGLDQTCVC